MKGYFTFVLHSHLPYVINHGEWPHGMDWLYEAAAETYLPLLKEFDSLAADGISAKVTLGITPILAEQLAAVSAGTEAWRAARVLAAGLRPARAQRLANGLLALSAWLACHQAMHAAARALADCAELIRESLKA